MPHTQSFVHARLDDLNLKTRLRTAKWSFNARRVPRTGFTGLVSDRPPRAGDLLLARVDTIGQHDGLQLASGRRARLHAEDEIVVCYGNRYASNQWEAIVPPTLEPCDLVAAGGVAGMVLSRHSSSRRPTGLTPLGLLAGDGAEPVNLSDHALTAREQTPDTSPPVVAVVGTSMDAGKTTTASALIRGLTQGGRRVAGIKVTGTGACGDYFAMVDAGAAWVADFVDAGFVSTYRLALDDLHLILDTLVAHAAASGADVIVAEVADGVAQPETAALLASERFRRAVHSVLLAAGDALGAQAAVRWLNGVGLPVKAISGIASASMLSAIEAQSLTNLPVMGLADLLSPDGASQCLSNGS